MDDDGSKSLSMSEFKKGLQEMNMNLSSREVERLFVYFDKDDSQTIDFEEFVQGIRDPLTPRRKALIDQAFDILDMDGNGVIDADEIASKYDPSKHPDVISGKKS